jgi:chromosomal replication initiation ATPase DnaA
MNLSKIPTFKLEAELARRPDARERLRRRCYASCREDSSRILREVSAAFHLTEADILGRSREPRITRARRVAMAAVLAEGHTLTNVGRFFDRDHTSVRTAVAKLRKSTSPHCSLLTDH